MIETNFNANNKKNFKLLNKIIDVIAINQRNKKFEKIVIENNEIFTSDNKKFKLKNVIAIVIKFNYRVEKIVIKNNVVAFYNNKKFKLNNVIAIVIATNYRIEKIIVITNNIVAIFNVQKNSFI